MTEVASGELTLCARHVDRAAIGTCTRCGTYYCGDCYKDLAGRRLCVSCLEIPGMDYLKETRDATWGKRDGWVWYLGAFMGVSQLGALASALKAQLWVDAIFTVVMVVVAWSYFMLKPWARKAQFGIMLMSIVRMYDARGEFAKAKVSEELAIIMPVAFLVFGTLLVGLAYTDTRNKLAFKIEVSELELRKLFERRNNAMATRSLVYSFLTFAIPLASLVTLAMGIRAFRRADPDAWPPVGGKVKAGLGIALSSLGLLFWAGIFTSAFRH